MPIQPNFVERTAFYTLNAAPGPMLDLAGALAYQTVSTAVHLNIFATLQKQPSTPAELAQTLNSQEKGTQLLLQALAGIGYVTEKDGRYHNTAMTEKWFLNGTMLDMKAAVTCWDAFLRDLWPQAPEVIRSGERPFDFYTIMEQDPALSHNFQQMMVGNANIVGPTIVKKVNLPDDAAKLLDVGGGHGQFAIHFCQTHPNLQATIIDSEVALNSARQNVDAYGLTDRITLYTADLWQTDWGQDNDLILLFNLLHHYDPNTCRDLLHKTRAALKPGGKVAIFDQVEGSVFGPASNAIVQLVGFMFHLFANGRTFTRDELTNILNDTNFHNIRFYPLRQAPGSSLLVAER